MKIPVVMTSILTGKQNERVLEMTREQIALYTSEHRPLIQDIFPEMNDEDREFLMTGITPEEWNKVFGNKEEE